jgi:predicted RNase H-like HicB family nuclease
MAGFEVRGRQRPTSVLRYGVLMEFTAVFKKVPEGYIAFVEELPGANTQGDTLDEARENLREAIELTLEANRAMAREATPEGDVIREQLRIAVG